LSNRSGHATLFESHARDQLLVVTGAGIILASGIPTSAAST
jgi:NAD-dependent SIR2 family protein deacetylase